ncbi:MAG TPA: M4 family metallopeptidase [bacterium]|nr:M4 family metallopeptidase [bacterium]
MKFRNPWKKSSAILFLCLVSIGIAGIGYFSFHSSQPVSPSNPAPALPAQPDSRYTSLTAALAPGPATPDSQVLPSAAKPRKPVRPTVQRTDSTTAKQAADRILAHFGRMQQRMANQPSKPMSGLPRATGPNVLNPEQQKAIDQMLADLGSGAVLHMDNVSGTLRHLEGDLKKLVDDSAAYQAARERLDHAGMAVALASEIKRVLNIQNPAEEFQAERIQHDELGMTHVILQQEYRGVPIWGAEIGVHFSAGHDPVRMAGVYSATPVNMPIPEVEISLETAVAKAQEAVGHPGPHLVPPRAQRMIYWDIDRAPVMCYNVDMTPNFQESWEIFISTADGSVVHKYNKVMTAAATGTAPDLKGTPRTMHCWESQGQYYAIDTTLPMYKPGQSQPPDPTKLTGALYLMDFRNADPNAQELRIYDVVTNNVNQWDPTAVSLMHNFRLTEDYYRKTFNYNSIDNNGMNIWAIIHWRFPTGQGGSTSDNACWNPGIKGMQFGDGEQYDGGILPHDLDTVAHEYTHGITNFTSNLIYENQSGALNEHFSDFFGCMVDRDNWLHGEETINVPGKIALRDLSNPGNPQVASPNPATMAEYKHLTLEQDHGGVHINMGIPCYMSYLLAEGLNGGIGKDKTERILFRCMTQYLTQRSQFIDYRRLCINAAQDLYGEAEATAVKNAFDAVGITDGGGGGTPPSTPGTPTRGNEAVLFLLADSTAGYDFFRDDFYYMLILNAAGNNQLAASRYVAGTRPATSGDGQWGVYVGWDNNVYWTDGQSEEQWTEEGIVRTLAMSKNLRYIAFTTINYDNFIYLIDIHSKTVSEVKLQVQLQSAGMGDLYFADVLTFNFRGDHLFYDGVAAVKLQSGQNIDAWGIYGLRLSDLSNFEFLAPLSGQQIGDPIFSHTNDALLLADMDLVENEQVTANVVSIDINQQKIGLLLKNTELLAKPSFRGDDKSILVRLIDQNHQNYLLVEGKLAADNLSVDTQNLQLVFSSNEAITYPFGFRIGEYTAQEGKIAVPARLDFGTVPVQAIAEQTLSITNQGNADLDVLNIAFEGENSGRFAHNGNAQKIPPGAQYQFQVACQPLQEGPVQAAMRIRSTDMNQPEVTVQLTAVGAPAAPPTPSPSAQPTPTATQTPTATVGIPTAIPTTPIPGPTATPTSGGAPEEWIYEFDQPSLAANGWNPIPGGFVPNTPAGTIVAQSFFGKPIASSKDNKGLIITVEPGQVAFLYAADPIPTGGNPVLLRLTVWADSPNAAVALVALKGILAAGVDGSIATHIPAKAARFVNQERALVLLYEPDQGEWITPAIQVASTGDTSTTVLIDKLDVVKLESALAYSGRAFSSQPLLHGALVSALPKPAQPILTYEFKENTLDLCGWSPIPGGFSGAAPGSIFVMGFFGDPIPSSTDKRGAMLSVQPGQVAFMYAKEPIATGGRPLLFRAVMSSDGANASVALVALKGNLAANAVDGSIATHIPATSASMTNTERSLVLLYEPDEGNLVTPVIQAAAASPDQGTAILLDRLEVYALDPEEAYLGSLCSSQAAKINSLVPTSTPASTPVPTATPVTPPTPTSTPLPQGIAEQEPNNSIQQPQNLGVLNMNGTISVSGSILKGGIYSGDADWYAFNLAAQATVRIRLDWNGQADLDMAVYDQNGDYLISDETTAKPVVLEGPLSPGVYYFVVASKDNPADYQFTLTAGAFTAPYANDVSILNGKYTQDPASLLWWYVFDGQGRYEYWGWNSLSGDVLLHSGTYTVAYPNLILNHDGKTEQFELSFESPTVFVLNGNARYVRG